MKKIYLSFIVCFVGITIKLHASEISNKIDIPSRQSVNIKIDTVSSVKQKGLELGVDFKLANRFSLGLISGLFSEGQVSGTMVTAVSPEDFEMAGRSFKVGIRPTFYFQEAFHNAFYLSGILDYKNTSINKSKHKIFYDILEKDQQIKVDTISIGFATGYQFILKNNFNIDLGIAFVYENHLIHLKKSILKEEQINIDDTNIIIPQLKLGIGYIF